MPSYKGDHVLDLGSSLRLIVGQQMLVPANHSLGSNEDAANYTGAIR